jgi:transposase-like protein
MAHRIREAMKDNNGGPLGGENKVVEADETYVGGKQRNRATRKVRAKQAVVSLVEREGKVRSYHVANVNAKTLRPLIVTTVDRKSHLMTDDSMVYTKVGNEFVGHTAVIHSKGEYVRKGGFAHSNTAENFFSIFKRGIIGIYHHVSEAHLGRYASEFDFRYNTRSMDDSERTDEALKGAFGKRLMYRRANEAAYA